MKKTLSLILLISLILSLNVLECDPALAASEGERLYEKYRTLIDSLEEAFCF